MMADIAVSTSHHTALLTSICALREHFSRHFDRGWLAILIDDLPIDFSTLRHIRHLLSVTDIYPEDLPELRFGAEQLTRFSSELRRHLLPVLRERLGISGLRPPTRRLDPTERVHRQLLCLAFPVNLERLEDLTRELSRLLTETEIA